MSYTPAELYIYIPITLKRSGTAPSDDTDHRSGYTIFTLIKNFFFRLIALENKKHKPCSWEKDFQHSRSLAEQNYENSSEKLLESTCQGVCEVWMKSIVFKEAHKSLNSRKALCEPGQVIYPHSRTGRSNLWKIITVYWILTYLPGTL